MTDRPIHKVGPFVWRLGTGDPTWWCPHLQLHRGMAARGVSIGWLRCCVVVGMRAAKEEAQ